jgi:hypothetical protein
MLTAGRVGAAPLFRLAAGSFRDATRVAGADPALWRAIFAMNQKDLRGAVTVFNGNCADCPGAGLCRRSDGRGPSTIDFERTNHDVVHLEPRGGAGGRPAGRAPAAPGQIHHPPRGVPLGPGPGDVPHHPPPRRRRLRAVRRGLPRPRHQHRVRRPGAMGRGGARPLRTAGTRRRSHLLRQLRHHHAPDHGRPFGPTLRDETDGRQEPLEPPHGPRGGAAPANGGRTSWRGRANSRPCGCTVVGPCGRFSGRARCPAPR